MVSPADRTREQQDVGALLKIRRSPADEPEDVGYLQPLPVEIVRPPAVDTVVPVFDSNALATVKVGRQGGPAYLHFVDCSHPNAVDVFLQLFDAASLKDVTIGTTTPRLSLLVPHGDGASYGGIDPVFATPIRFERGILYAVTTTPTGSTAPGTGATLNLGVR